MTAPHDPGPKPELRWLPVDRLAVDHRYQRTLESDRSQALVGRIAEGFRWSAFQAVLAAPDGAKRWLVLDGQHRVEAARRVGIKEVPCVVVAAGSIAEQAAAFVQANRDRVAVNPFALYHAQLVAGDVRAQAIDRVCKEIGLSIPRYACLADQLKPGQTLALGSIGQLVARYGEGGASLIVGAVADAYREFPGFIRASLIRGMAKLYESGTSETARRQSVGRASAWLKTQTPGTLLAKASRRKTAYGGTEADNLLALIKSAIGAASREALPDASPGGIRPPTRQQLMGRR